MHHHTFTLFLISGGCVSSLGLHAFKCGLDVLCVKMLTPVLNLSGGLVVITRPRHQSLFPFKSALCSSFPSLVPSLHFTAIIMTSPLNSLSFPHFSPKASILMLWCSFRLSVHGELWMNRRQNEEEAVKCFTWSKQDFIQVKTFLPSCEGSCYGTVSNLSLRIYCLNNLDKKSFSPPLYIRWRCATNKGRWELSEKTFRSF